MKWFNISCWIFMVLFFYKKTYYNCVFFIYTIQVFFYQLRTQEKNIDTFNLNKTVYTFNFRQNLRSQSNTHASMCTPQKTTQKHCTLGVRRTNPKQTPTAMATSLLLSTKPPAKIQIFLPPRLNHSSTTISTIKPVSRHHGHHHHRYITTISFSSSQPETDCPVPIDQQPINEYQSLSNSFPFSWASGDTLEYFSRVFVTGASFSLFVGLPVAWFGSVGAESEPWKRVLCAVSSGLFIATLAVVRMYLGWAYVGNRLLSATVECNYFHRYFILTFVIFHWSALVLVHLWNSVSLFSLLLLQMKRQVGMMGRWVSYWSYNL